MNMSEQCRAAITSEEYADFLVEYTGNVERIKTFFKTDCLNIINQTYAVVHIPLDQLNQNSLYRFGYSAFPRCYGLQDTSSLEASGVNKVQNLPNFSLRGSGVLVGFIDTGIEYTNPVFINPDNTTRILSIWDQTIQSVSPTLKVGFGTEYSQDEINKALSSDNPLLIVPSVDEVGHGTFLAGVAAGSKDDINDFSGVVPDSEILVVKLKQTKNYLRELNSIPEGAICFQENDIMHGVEYLVNKARELRRPIAICISVGSNQGGHDGRGYLGTYLSSRADDNGVVIVVAAGNEGNRGHHYYGTIDEAMGSEVVEFNVGKNENGFMMELWGKAPNTYSIDILSPTGEYIPRIPARLGEHREIRFLFESTVIFVDYNLVEMQTGDQLIVMRFKNPMEGIWKIRVYARGGTPLVYNVWLPIDNFITKETYFLNPNPNTTITDPGNSTIPIAITSYNTTDQSLFINASRGYTRTSYIKPDLAAPGVSVYGPLLNNTFGYSTGSSIAAAHTVGLSAMLLEWGITRGNYYDMDSIEVKQFLIRGAIRSPNNTYPNREWGYGIVNIFNTFEDLRSEFE